MIDASIGSEVALNPGAPPSPHMPLPRCRRLCAVMLDVLGRDMMVRREYGVDEKGWPGVFKRIIINQGQKVRETHGCLPVV